ncbi:MAG: hypothetical protein R6V36_07475, partial [Psychroflexus sp.]
MKTKLLTSFLIGCSLLVGIAVYNNSNNNSVSDIEIAVANTDLRSSESAVKREIPNSFFKIFTDQTSTAFNTPDLDINNSLGGFGGYGIEFQNGIKTFLRCTNVGSGDFQFEDPNQNSYPPGTLVSIDWGDGNISTQVEDHSYTNGLYTIEYNVTLPGSNTETSIFRVFVGDTPPSVSVKLSGNNHCLPNKYDYSIEITDNQPGNIYTININDGSAPIVIDSDTLAIGADITLPYTHTFSSTSCGVSSTVNNSPTPNSFSITVRATNPCDTSGNFNSVGPIRVSEPSEADFIVPAPIACVGSTVNFTDNSFGGVNTSESGCNSEYGKYWEISPAVGTTIAGGS